MIPSLVPFMVHFSDDQRGSFEAILSGSSFPRAMGCCVLYCTVARNAAQRAISRCSPLADSMVLLLGFDAKGLVSLWFGTVLYWQYVDAELSLSVTVMAWPV